MKRILTTTKECVEYTISMFASDPIGFIDEVNEEEIEVVIKDQYMKLKELCNETGADFYTSITSWNKGKKLYEKYN